jgi:hypothetical protein
MCEVPFLAFTCHPFAARKQKASSTSPLRRAGLARPTEPHGRGCDRHRRRTTSNRGSGMEGWRVEWLCFSSRTRLSLRSARLHPGPLGNRSATPPRIRQVFTMVSVAHQGVSNALDGVEVGKRDEDPVQAADVWLHRSAHRRPRFPTRTKRPLPMRATRKCPAFSGALGRSSG